MDESMAETLPEHNQLAQDLVRKVLAGEPVTADDLVATGTDVEVLHQAATLLLQHLENLRGFKPLAEHYAGHYVNLPTLMLGTRRADRIHMLKVSEFSMRLLRRDMGIRNNPAEITVYLTREGKWCVIDRSYPEKAATWHQAIFGLKHFDGNAANHATIRELVEYLTGILGAESVFTRPGRREHYGGSSGDTYWRHYRLESPALALAESIRRIFGQSIDSKQREVEREKRSLAILKQLIGRYTTVDREERAVT